MSMHRCNSAASIDRLDVTLDDLATVILGRMEDPAPIAKNGRPKTSRFRGDDREVLRLGKPAEWLNFPGEANVPAPLPPASSSLGREIEAMRGVAAALAGLDGAACRRVLEYVGRHLSGVDEG
jgi:hypothetical protein